MKKVAQYYNILDYLLGLKSSSSSESLSLLSPPAPPPPLEFPMPEAADGARFPSCMQGEEDLSPRKY